MFRIVIVSSVLACLSIAGAASAEAPEKGTVLKLVPQPDFTGMVEVVGDDLLVKSHTGTHHFTGARACDGLSGSPFVHVRMKQQSVALNGGGVAQVVYGSSMASTRTCKVTYEGLYTPPTELGVTPLER
ncbi:hypothetical protein [Asticcacaulis sp. AND118]|uniref:hypothetical protein n=1 Tax=Asticcacaulis sp. AND118 TaxID=2840468 RepID=UPI001CFFC178|nr:hypothetical protein [Asticcacaulis sp. AND118]UDF04966.1 hypothetical protein LH365_16345 [Asticcacaulis sp. AND118]